MPPHICQRREGATCRKTGLSVPHPTNPRFKNKYEPKSVETPIRRIDPPNWTRNLKGKISIRIGVRAAATFRPLPRVAGGAVRVGVEARTRGGFVSGIAARRTCPASSTPTGITDGLEQFVEYER